MVVSHDSETPAHGQQVFTVCGFIHRREAGTDEVFLAKRADTKKFLPGIYELPGGHVDFGEEFADALRREVLEEFGMRIEVGDPFFVYTYENIVKGSHSVEVVYFAKFINHISNIRINQEDHSEFGWFSEQEVKGVVIDNRRSASLKASVKKSVNYDREILAIQKGFALMGGQSLNFGKS